MGTTEETPKPATINPKIEIEIELLTRITKEPKRDNTIDMNKKLYIPKIDFNLSPDSLPNTIDPLNAIAAIPILNPSADR